MYQVYQAQHRPSVPRRAARRRRKEAQERQGRRRCRGTGRAPSAGTARRGTQPHGPPACPGRLEASLVEGLWGLRRHGPGGSVASCATSRHDGPASTRPAQQCERQRESTYVCRPRLLPFPPFPAPRPLPLLPKSLDLLVPFPSVSACLSTSSCSARMTLDRRLMTLQ